jgi:DNA polymerase III delta prime subunit
MTVSQSEQPDSLQEQTTSANGDTGGGDAAGTHIQDVNGPVAIGGGDAVDMRGAVGPVYKPGGPVTQHFGDKIINRITQIFTGDVDAERARRRQENRKAMIQKVRQAWVDGVLRRSLYQVARIDLGLEEQPDAVAHPWDMIVQEQGQPPRDLTPGTRMGEVFDELGGALLILGAPGTGKTTLLLELADELLGRAEHDDGHRIPVVFNLSSWAVKRKPLVEWLVDELNERYDVPRKMGQAWVDADAILPLLDGLDEVAQEHREGCAEAINTFRGNHGMMPLVVCCRIEEYEALGAKLRLLGAILIQPMTREQVDVYLARAGQPLAGVRQALQADATLYELFDTPLMLSIAALSYQDTPAQAVRIEGTAAERREHLFAAYVDAMFRRRGKEQPYTSAQTEHWLRWLARQMVDHEQSVFYLEYMQPDWLPTRRQQRLVTWRVTIASVLVGVLVGGLFFGLFFGLGFGLFVGLLFGLVGYAKSIVPVETVSWSWPRAWAGLFVGLFVGLFFGLLFGLFFGLGFGLGFGLVGVLGFGLVGGLLFGLRFGGRAYLQHLVLRLLLRRNNFAPLNYVPFLDYATERIFLRKVGGGYIFVHRLLMDHFSEQWEASE